jgi:hypothetical protein
MNDSAAFVAETIVRTPAPPLPANCPRLPPVFSVLICDHRPEDAAVAPQFASDLCRRMREVLIAAFSHAREAFDRFSVCYDGSAPRLRVVTVGTSGAEGLSIGSIAGQLNAELVVVSAGKPDRMDAGISLVCFDLPAHADDAARELAAEARDQLALAHVDLVIAAWDGTNGEAMRLIHQAVLARKPVVWIDVANPANLQMHLLDRVALLDRRLLPLQSPETLAEYLRNCFSFLDPAALRRDVALQLAPQAADEMAHRRTDLDDILAARLPDRVWREWSGALDEFLWRLIGLQVRPEPRAAAAADPPADPLFAWMGAMAAVTAGSHRSAVWMLNIFAALAVLCAVGGFIATPKTAVAELAPKAEFLLLVAIVLLLVLAKRQHWHRSWLFCRSTAEQLRVQDMLAALLSVPPAAARSPWRCGEGGPVLEDASAWLVQRWLIGRGFGPGGTQAPLVRMNDLDIRPLHQAIEAQIGWMKHKCKELERRHRHMEILSPLLFVAALAAVMMHFGQPDWHWLLLLTGAGPAIGAAVAGILNHTEVRRVAQSYARVAHRLHDIAEAAVDEAERALRAADEPLRWWHRMQVRRLGIEAARVMAEENQSWRDLLSSRTPALPG